MKKIIISIVTIILFWTSAAFAQDEPVRSIVNVTGDLYRFQQNNHYGVFLVTDEGIILADPISHDNAVWLKAQLDERFGVPVKYVIYSHDHADHTSGGEVFADTAIFVAHENAKAKIAESGHTPVPQATFKGPRTELSLGGKTVELFYFWPSHSDNLIGVLFPKEKALFLVDLVAVNRLPYRNLRDYYLPSAFYVLQRFEYLKIKTLIPGHGPMGNMKDLINHKNYLITLYENVSEEYHKGTTLEEAQQNLLFSKYKDWGQYEAWRELNIEGVYRILDEQENGPGSEFMPLIKANPIYPPNAARKGICGWVRVKYDVNENGGTENVSVDDSEPKGVFDSVSVKAAEMYKYKPGSPRDDVVSLIKFEIQNECFPPLVREYIPD